MIIRFFIYGGVIISFFFIFLPVISGPIFREPRRVDDKSQCVQLTLAIEAYYRDFLDWPSVDNLRGDNKKAIVYFTGSFRNSIEKRIEFAIDRNGDGVIDSADSNQSTPPNPVKAKVCSWTYTKDNELISSW